MITEPALMCQASSAIFLNRLVQSLPPAGEYFYRRVSQMDLNPVAVELDFMNPTGAGRYLLDRAGQRRLDKAGIGRLDADGRWFFPLKRHAELTKHDEGFKFPCAGRFRNPFGGVERAADYPIFSA